MNPLTEALKRAVAFHRVGNLVEADRGYRSILARTPGYFDALHLLGVLELQRGHLEEARHLIGAALAVNRRSADAHAHLGSVLHALGRFAEAVASYDEALAIKPSSAGILSNRGITLVEMGRYGEALAIYDMALAIAPNLAEALSNRSAPLWRLRRYEEALDSCDRALAIKPDVANGMSNRGAVLNSLRRHDEALASCDVALAANPADANAHFNRGVALHGLRRYEEALASYDRAIAENPGRAEAPNARAITLLALARYAEAVKGFHQALELDPDIDFAVGGLLLSSLRCCDWKTYADQSANLATALRAGKTCATPFAMIALGDSASAQLACAKAWVRETCPPARIPLWNGERYAHERIGVAYLSADFHEHATAYLTADLFARHDRGRFEVCGLSFGPDIESAMRSRLIAGFDRFVDIRDTSDANAARLLRDLEVDIAVDLKGFTEDSRPGILAHRPAPIQVNYLGFPGTMGAAYIDYIMADRFVIPHNDTAWYSEKVVLLPDSYQVNDPQRKIALQTPTRAEFSLPEDGFVFCCFNNSYKITPRFFDIWMRLLRRVEGSVLWLLRANAEVEPNLRREAARCGVEADRLVFAPRVPLDEHLARHRRADLFVDTLPCNAHTTASDALWAGLPVLTCTGSTFAGRVAASLLHSVGLPELVTTTLDAYEARALELATHANLLASFKERLSHNREYLALFDAARTCRHIEAAYVNMWERHRRGEPPASFAVAPIA